jgi:hypothetical protein
MARVRKVRLSFEIETCAPAADGLDVSREKWRRRSIDRKDFSPAVLAALSENPHERDEKGRYLDGHKV